ncbi:hypothetical protein DBV08_18195 [Rhodococcus sp. KBW08]|nr:hypothetical protein DBV08_18195 [Rhodococcus sp. KBW08]
MEIPTNTHEPLLLNHVDGVSVDLERCIRGRLRESYPVGARDVEVRIGVTGDLNVLTATLNAAVAAVSHTDPLCKKIVFCIDKDENRHGAHRFDEVLEAAQRAGFRFVVDVDSLDAELSVLVHEPAWVTKVDIDLDRVPGT